ncbi:acyltransferase family protein [Caulobacter soli]|uniref:acyltransferase family protein n=1 Tax=Caulobacter soli TaxID=2708539 RepID=UPI0013EBB436|nr:acyltransferase [Caulobacter soli]
MSQIVDPNAGGAERVVALDGLRGLMTAFVVISHYFAELPGGVNALMFGWVGVDMFFVLSGYLVGRLILEKSRHANFFSVFYIRRTLRIIPAYVVTIVIVSGLMAVCDPAWSGARDAFPLWAYLSFSQPFFMISSGSIGAHWLAPTWTLALEEHFYLLAPLVIVLAPRRLLPWLLAGTAAMAVLVRLTIHLLYPHNPMAALVLLPSRADLLCLGMLAAVAMTSWKVDWPRFDFALRLTPILALVAILGLKAVDSVVTDALMPLAMAVGCASFLLALVRDAPEARRFKSPVLRFLGDNGYCIYLTHIPVLGLMHGLILGQRPALETPAQWGVSLAALPVCVLVGWGMTKLIEEPLTRYGRSWRWSDARRAKIGAAAEAGAS